ncbi:MAG: DUF4147 domain-containing protein, partial [bacterium]|nr:DUF4147 domain-containing protein [bacterium]
MLALGKASRTLAAEALRLWGSSITSGLVVTLDNRPISDEVRSVFRIVRGSHPFPTAASLRSGRAVVSFLESLNPNQPLTVLLSGGASAQLVLPRGTLDVNALAEISRRLMRSGATIQELNTVRRHLDGLKGGGLAERFRGPIRTLILSDVVGD